MGDMSKLPGMNKGGTTQQTPTYYMPDNTGMMQAMMQNYSNITNQIMQSNSQMMQQQMSNNIAQNSYESDLPDVMGANQANTEWAAKVEALKAKAAADYSAEKDKRKGRASTILSSPLLDEQDPATLGSIITGG